MSKPLLFIKESASFAPVWQAHAAEALPQYEAVTSLDGQDIDRVELALVWKPEPGHLASLPNLKLVVSVGAGVDHIVLSDPDYPRHIPLVRMVDPGLTQGMCDYALWACLSVLRESQRHARLQRAQDWQLRPLETAPQRRVLVLGLGQIGGPVAQRLQSHGFVVAGWSRSAKAMAGIEVFSGAEALPEALGWANMVVNLLPATQQTRELINTTTLAHFRPGAAFINAGRGTTVDEAALLAALESGQIGQAYLDVFQQEPLPSDHPLWQHPHVTITPHNAAITHPSSGIRVVARAVEEMTAGAPLSNQVDWAQGY